MREKKSVFWGVVLLVGAVALLAQRLGDLQGIGFWAIVLNVFLISLLLKSVIRGSVGSIFLSAVLLMLVNDRLGYLGDVGFWPIVLNISLAAILINAVIWGKIGTILFSIAFLIIANDELLHLEAITPWPVLGAALLGVIGIKMLFPRAGRHLRGHLIQIGDKQHGGMVKTYSQDGGRVDIDNVFGQSVRLIRGDVSQVDINNAFGTIQVYFNDACPVDGNVCVNIDGAFGTTEVYVPASWKVSMEVDKVFGNCEERGGYEEEGEVLVRIIGDLAFGSITVIHV